MIISEPIDKWALSALRHIQPPTIGFIFLNFRRFQFHTTTSLHVGRRPTGTTRATVNLLQFCVLTNE